MQDYPRSLRRSRVTRDLKLETVQTTKLLHTLFHEIFYFSYENFTLEVLLFIHEGFYEMEDELILINSLTSKDYLIIDIDYESHDLSTIAT